MFQYYLRICHDYGCLVQSRYRCVVIYSIFSWHSQMMQNKLLSRNYSSYWNLYCRVYTYKSTDTVIFKWILKTLHLSCWVIIDYVQTPPLFFQMRLAMLTQWYSLSVKDTSGNRLREYCKNDLTMLHSPWLLHACTDSEIKYRTPDSCIVFAISKQKLLNIYIYNNLDYYQQ